jgi:hypothetical protein
VSPGLTFCSFDAIPGRRACPFARSFLQRRFNSSARANLAATFSPPPCFFTEWFSACITLGISLFFGDGSSSCQAVRQGARTKLRSLLCLAPALNNKALNRMPIQPRNHTLQTALVFGLLDGVNQPCKQRIAYIVIHCDSSKCIKQIQCIAACLLPFLRSWRSC